MKKQFLAKVFAVAVIGIAAASFTGCGVSYTATSTSSTTTTDADGNSVTTTTTTVNDNGKVTRTTTEETTTAETTAEESTTEETTAEATSIAEEAADEIAEEDIITATVHFVNEAKFDIVKLQFSSSTDDDWGPDILGEFAPLADGETINFYDQFRYTEEMTEWDMKVTDEDGAYIEFQGLNIAEAEDSEDISIVLTYDAETDSYTAFVE